VKQLVELLKDANVTVRFGLRQQGHIPTIQRMLAEGATWDQIGAAIGWQPAAARQWFADEWGVTLTVPMPENLTNRASGRTHWRVIHNAKKAYAATLDRYLAAGLVESPPTQPYEKAIASSVMTLGGAMDDDNALARHKWLVDWLVKRRYLQSDRKTCLTWAGLPEQRVTRKEPASIRITLTIPAPAATAPREVAG
jgi:hypothetical protein